MALPQIPILRRGQIYESLDHIELNDVCSGEAVATVSQANAGLIRRDLRRSSRDALRAVPSERLLEICADAGRLFMEADLPLSGGQMQSPAAYMDLLSACSGLPYSLIRRNMAKINQVFREMPTILRGLTRGMDLSVLDTGMGEQSGVPISYFAVTEALGVVLPSNSPGVNSLWMPAIALKIPVVLKPGREEPWTPFRIIQAFIAAGCPPEAFSFYPTDHEGSAAVLEGCGRALVFGDVSTVERYSSNPAVEVHGPGWSKILIGDDCIERWPEFVDLIVTSISDNGGRSCVNASALLVPRYGDEIAEAVATKLASLIPRSKADDDAILAGFANRRVAESIDSAITADLEAPGATDITQSHRTEPRLANRDGSMFLLPTLVKCDSWDHPLANREFLFPYASLVEMPQDQMPEKIGPSLVVTAITQDAGFIDRLIASPHIARLNVGPAPTTRVQWDQPHEGNLFEFLYRRRAIHRVAVDAPAK